MIAIENATKYYGEKPILINQTLQFPVRGVVSVVGPNGVGKSTLLQMISGEEELDGGRITIGKNVRLGVLPQEANQNPLLTVLDECKSGNKELLLLEENLNKLSKDLKTHSDEKILKKYEAVESEFRLKGGYAQEAVALRVLKGLGFSEEFINKNPLELSGGWRMRLELAKLFVSKFEVLVLDEPTNHLDLPSMAWVESYLKNFSGLVVFVSHDRNLLDRLSDETVFLHAGYAKKIPGNFSSAIVKLREQQQRQQAAIDRLDKEQSKLEIFVSRFGAKATKAKQAQSRVKMIERLENQKDDLKNNIFESGGTKSFMNRFPVSRRSGREILKCESLSIGYGEDLLCSNINFLLERGQKVAIIGSNGIGKSTLVKTIMGEVHSLDGSSSFGSNVDVAYFAQNQSEHLDKDATVIDSLLHFNHTLGRREAQTILGHFMFSNDEVEKKVGYLSGGELNRLGLSCLMSKSSNFLILDEPTNHLDMTSIEVLKEALVSYEGSVLFVSHDADFINSVCTHVLVIVDGGAFLFEGQIEDYLSMCEKAGVPNIFQPDILNENVRDQKKTSSDEGEASISHEQVKQMQRTLKKNKNEMQNIESKVDNIDLEISRLSELQLELHSDYEKAASCQAEIADLTAKKERLEENYLVLLEEAEELESALSAIGRLG